VKRAKKLRPVPIYVPTYDDGVREGIRRAALLVPRNWCDPILSGPERVVKDSLHRNDLVEVLLGAVKQRILEASPVEVRRVRRGAKRRG